MEVKSGDCGQEPELSWVVALLLSFDYGVLGHGCYRVLGSADLLRLHLRSCCQQRTSECTSF